MNPAGFKAILLEVPLPKIPHLYRRCVGRSRGQPKVGLTVAGRQEVWRLHYMEQPASATCPPPERGPYALEWPSRRRSNWIAQRAEIGAKPLRQPAVRRAECISNVHADRLIHVSLEIWPFAKESDLVQPIEAFSPDDIPVGNVDQGPLL